MKTLVDPLDWEDAIICQNNRHLSTGQRNRAENSVGDLNPQKIVNGRYNVEKTKIPNMSS